MRQAVYRTGAMPEAALDASALFHAQHVPAIRERAEERPETLVVIFPPAPYDHRAWRRAVIADLARAMAPIRIMGLTDDDPVQEVRILAYFASAPGVTGQMLCAYGPDGEKTA